MSLSALTYYSVLTLELTVSLLDSQNLFYPIKPGPFSNNGTPVALVAVQQGLDMAEVEASSTEETPVVDESTHEPTRDSAITLDEEDALPDSVRSSLQPWLPRALTGKLLVDHIKLQDPPSRPQSPGLDNFNILDGVEEDESKPPYPPFSIWNFPNARVPIEAYKEMTLACRFGMNMTHTFT